MEQLYTFDEVAKAIKLTRRSLERWEKQGKLKVIRINGKPRVAESEIERLKKGE